MAIISSERIRVQVIEFGGLRNRNFSLELERTQARNVGGQGKGEMFCHARYNTLAHSRGPFPCRERRRRPSLIRLADFPFPDLFPQREFPREMSF
jgi:hypothetical protein